MILPIENDAVEGLTAAGATVMIVSITFVLVLVAWCVSRILREPDPGGHHHAPLEMDRGDDD